LELLAFNVQKCKGSRAVADFGGQGGHAPKTPEVALCTDEL